MHTPDSNHQIDRIMNWKTRIISDMGYRLDRVVEKRCVGAKTTGLTTNWLLADILARFKQEAKMAIRVFRLSEAPWKTDKSGRSFIRS